MQVLTAHKPGPFKAPFITRRDLRMFGFSAALFGSLAVGAVTLAQPAHSQTAGAAICSADKFLP